MSEPTIDETKLTEVDQFELARFRKAIGATNACLVDEEYRMRPEFRMYVLELQEPGGNTFDEFNFKSEDAAKLALEHVKKVQP